MATEVPMAQQPKMPFPGESPTISLAMAAGEQFGFHEEEAKPKTSAAKKSKPGAPKSRPRPPKLPQHKRPSRRRA